MSAGTGSSRDAALGQGKPCAQSPHHLVKTTLCGPLIEYFGVIAAIEVAAFEGFQFGDGALAIVECMRLAGLPAKCGVEGLTREIGHFLLACHLSPLVRADVDRRGEETVVVVADAGDALAAIGIIGTHGGETAARYFENLLF